MGNTVTVAIKATDDFSGIFNKLNDSVAKGTLTGNLWSSTIAAGIDLAKKGLSSLSGALTESMNIQQQTIMGAGTIMTLTGKSYQQATEYIDAFTVKMSKIAATLPGQTADYVNFGKGIMDNLIPAFKDMNGVLDQAGFDKYLEGITKFGGLRASTSGVDQGLAQLAVSKALGGSSISELTRLKFFEANPAVLNQMEAEAKKLGKQWEDLSARERAEVLEKALKVPDEVIEASRNSISGLVEGFKSTLFDPNTGLFGLLRDLDPNKSGTQNVLTHLQTLLKNLIGDGGLLSKISNTLSILGINFGDPLIAISNVIDLAAAQIKKLADFFDKINSISIDSLLNGKSISASLSDLVVGVFDWLQGILASLADSLNSSLGSLGSSDYANAGALVGQIVAGLFNTVGSFLQTLDWGKVGQLLINILGGTIISLGSFLANLDTGGILTLITTILFPFLTTALVAVGGGIIAAIGAIPIGLTAAAALAIYLVGKTIYENWNGIVAQVKPIWDSVAKQITGVFDIITGVLTLNGDLIKKGLSNFFGGLIDLFSALGAKIDQAKSLMGIKTSGQERADQSSKLADGQLAAAGGANQTVKGYVPNYATGYDPFGLLTAANRESAAMPSGASLSIANSSETILTAGQASSLRPGANLSIGNLTIQTAATDAKAIAQDIFKEIGAQWNEYSQNRLATIY